MAVGVLALQGSFHEHILALNKLGMDATEVRKPEQLEGLSGLIIPGGESTTMAKLAESYNLFPALRKFTKSGKPVWGTCAGLIFLADRAVGQKAGGQELLGGLDCTVHRNFFGSQINSFETELLVPALEATEGGPPSFRAVFIRAPAIIESGPAVEILAEYYLPADQQGTPDHEEQRVAVAVRQGNVLATAFHPELTSDTRWHSLFLKMVGKNEEDQPTLVIAKRDARKDLPVFCHSDHLSFEIQ